ncbi:tryptophan--tRNA ligase, partial [Candidatus Bathyarchaeota archaeon]|nr:tryptophan--tRNA ligase [Candidatus Bathyarchaeota archaeon]
DRREEIETKIMNAFTGGQPTLREHREKGGNPSVCSIFQYYNFLFEDNDEKLRKIYEDCRRGEIFCGECKKRLSERVVKFIEEHKERREKAKSKLDDFILKD